MSEKIFSWFHCGRCGSLFQSPIGDTADRLCSECGLHPSLGIEVPPQADGAAAEPDPEPAAVRERISHKKRKRSYLMLKLIVGWLVFITAIIFGARHLWQDQPVKAPIVHAEEKPGTSADDIALLNEAGPPSGAAFSGFLAAGTPEQRNQYVLSPVTTAARMARFYELNPMVNVAPESVSLAGSEVLHLPSGRAIESFWNTTDGRQLDAVFVEQDGEWRLDWDHFVRFSTYPWALFLAGSGESEGEFRLLARQRLAEERKDAEALSIVLYAPRFGSVSETGFQSPEFLIPRAARNGRLLDAAFKAEGAGKRVFNLTAPNPNPEGLIRVRVKVRRLEENMERRFELLEVVACHWYSVDVPGVEIPAEAGGK